LYYGLPLVSFAILAAVEGLRSPSGHRLAAGRWGPAVAALAIVLDVSSLDMPGIPLERREVLATMAGIPRSAGVQGMSCFVPILGYERERAPLAPGDSVQADFLILRTEETTWPFREAEARALASDALASGRYRPVYQRGGFAILEARKAQPSGHR